jgi:hypothetical protein
MVKARQETNNIRSMSSLCTCGAQIVQSRRPERQERSICCCCLTESWHLTWGLHGVQDYKYVGRLMGGRFYDAAGAPTAELRRVEAAAARATAAAAAKAAAGSGTGPPADGEPCQLRRDGSSGAHSVSWAMQSRMYTPKHSSYQQSACLFEQGRCARYSASLLGRAWQRR